MTGSAADIERQIDHTRAELGLTLEALERKLAGRYLVEKGIDMFKGSVDGSDLLRSGLGAVRAHPFPVALIGVGAAWLFASSTAAGANGRVRAAGRIGVGAVGDSRSRDRAPGHTGNPVVDQSGPRRGNGWVHEVADQAAGAARGTLRAVRDSGEVVIDQASGRATRIADQVAETFERHPLLIGAVGAMAGALFAALLPATRVEDAWIGATGDDLRNKAEGFGHEAVVRVCDVAERSGGAAAEAAYQVVKDAAEKLAPR